MLFHRSSLLPTLLAVLLSGAGCGGEQQCLDGETPPRDGPKRPLCDDSVVLEPKESDELGYVSFGVALYPPEQAESVCGQMDSEERARWERYYPFEGEPTIEYQLSCEGQEIDRGFLELEESLGERGFWATLEEPRYFEPGTDCTVRWTLTDASANTIDRQVPIEMTEAGQTLSNQSLAISPCDPYQGTFGPVASVEVETLPGNVYKLYKLKSTWGCIGEDVSISMNPDCPLDYVPPRPEDRTPIGYHHDLSQAFPTCTFSYPMTCVY